MSKFYPCERCLEFPHSDEDGMVILDVFDAGNDNNEDAHVESIQCATDEAKDAAQSCAA